MSRFRLLFTALLLSASTVAAQGGMGGPPSGGPGGMGGRGGMAGQGGMMNRQNEMLFKGITLTDAQRAKVDSIQTKGREEMMAMMQGGGMQAMQDPGMREHMMQMRAKQMADIRAVLTADQQALYDKNLAEMPQGPGGGRRPPR